MKQKEIIPKQGYISKKRYQPPKEIHADHKEFLTSIGLKLKALRNKKHISITRLSKDLMISRNKYAQMEEGMLYFNLLSVLQVLDYHNVNAKKFFNKL